MAKPENWRVAGICSRDPDRVDRLRARLEALEGASRTFFYPPDRPRVAAIVAENREPPVQWARSDDGSFIFIDGEVYGAESLCRETAQGSSLAERILTACHEGDLPDVLRRLDAAASFTLLDARRQELTLARDHAGCVPCFCAELEGDLLWASDLPTLLGLGVSRRVHTPALDFFLAAGFVPAPWTLVEGIQKLPRGHYMTAVSGKVGQPKPFWTPTCQPKLDLGQSERRELLRLRLEEALRRRHPGDESLGVLLSGGVDSSLVVGGLARWLDAPFETFTFRYEQYEGRYNEVEPARRTAERFDVRHHVISCGPADIEAKLEWMIRIYGEPFTYGLHSFKLDPIAEHGVTTLLSGAGPDGWYLHESDAAAQRFRCLPSFLRRLIAGTSEPFLWLLADRCGRAASERSRLTARRADKALRILRCAETGTPMNCNVPVTNDRLRARLYGEPARVTEAREAASDLLAPVLDAFATESDEDRVPLIGMRLLSADSLLFWLNQWSRGTGFSIRHPYFDRDLLEVVFRLPRTGNDKDDLRELAATLMPREAAWARKIPQSIPIKEWFRGPLEGLLGDVLAPENLRRHGLFDPDAVGAVIDEHVTGVRSHTWTLWALLSITVWQETFRVG